MNAFSEIRKFEDELAEYTGAPYCVAVNSCTMALFLACKLLQVEEVEIPKFTYNGVAAHIIHAGGKVKFRDEKWKGEYQLKPYPIWDSARRTTSDMYRPGQFQCLSFHWSKILGIQHGGAILHDDPEANMWFRKARFDGRTEGVAPKDDHFILGWHCPMPPENAAAGRVRLSFLPKHNKDLPNSDYKDLSLVPAYR